MPCMDVTTCLHSSKFPRLDVHTEIVYTAVKTDFRCLRAPSAVPGLLWLVTPPVTRLAISQSAMRLTLRWVSAAHRITFQGRGSSIFGEDERKGALSCLGMKPCMPSRSGFLGLRRPQCDMDQSAWRQRHAASIVSVPLSKVFGCSEGPCLARSLHSHRRHWRLVCPVLVPRTRSTARIGCSPSAFSDTENPERKGSEHAPSGCQRAS